jgi:hypothetical protein
MTTFEAKAKEQMEGCVRTTIHPGLCTVSALSSQWPNLFLKKYSNVFILVFRSFWALG